ncbi:hypothetical protein RR48_01340 [Papilio machaon]|uniref:Ig-like domain-containing protein n=1 Tax=Papilio machaon TaxID=76193 RepID=A0A0N0PFQ1_PAPMA|nr:hypothetical protein RR48_01340 [Papilio machaon]
MALLFGAIGVLALVSRTGCTGNPNGVGTNGVSEDYPDMDLGMAHRGPHFDVAYSRNVTALVGKTAQLNCRVHDLGNRTVSWIRHRDIHLLTSGRMTYTSDQRFISVHNPHTEDWILKIRFPQRRDSGVYECQVGTTPPIGHRMYLSEINYDSPRGGVSVITEKGETTTSHLLVQKAKAPDSGRYTCAPANANPRSVIVHVLSGEHPAAMQHGGQLRLQYPISAVLLSVIVTLTGC